MAASNCAALGKRGAFILFEGVDRSGKTTQCKRLVDYLKGKGVPTEFMRFPGGFTFVKPAGAQL